MVVVKPEHLVLDEFGLCSILMGESGVCVLQLLLLLLPELREPLTTAISQESKRTQRE